MNAPQIIMLIIVGLATAGAIVETNPRKALAQTIGIVGMQALIWWGGFWS